MPDEPTNPAISAQDPTTIIGSRENLAKYAPEYKAQGIQYLGSAHENEIIQSRMNESKPKEYRIGSITESIYHDDHDKPLYEVEFYSRDNPNFNEPINEFTHLTPPNDDHQPYHLAKPIVLSKNKTLQLLDHLDARASKFTVGNELMLGQGDNELGGNLAGQVFEYQPGFKAPDDPNAKHDGLMHPDLKQMQPDPKYVQAQDQRHNVTPAWQAESRKIWHHYDELAQQNQNRNNIAIENSINQFERANPRGMQNPMAELKFYQNAYQQNLKQMASSKQNDGPEL